MKAFNYIRGFFGRSQVAIPLAFKFLLKTMKVLNPDVKTRSMTHSVWRDERGGFHSSSSSSSAPFMIHNSEKSDKQARKLFEDERKVLNNGH